MSKFLTGKELEEAIYDIIWDAKQKLLIVSPYIKLDDYFKKLFDKHENNPNIHLMLVFGKNEMEVRKSMSSKDFEYFKKFPNITIVHVPELHAKYYGNEYSGMITSINLYDYSFLNNIEFGVYNSSSEKSFFSLSSSTADDDAWDKCIDIAKESNVVFIKRPVYDVKRGILKTSKNYIASKVLHDSTEYYYKKSKGKNFVEKRVGDFPEELDINADVERPQREEVKVEEKPKHGYCIRTGQQIPFNPKQPLSRDAWRVWNEFGNVDFPEKFCHKTGEKSNGKTSMRNPILE